jgi:hypothetical protein
VNAEECPLAGMYSETGIAHPTRLWVTVKTFDLNDIAMPDVNLLLIQGTAFKALLASVCKDVCRSVQLCVEG